MPQVRKPRLALILAVILALLPFGAAPSTAATTASITVSTAIHQQNGSVATVEGYVVGQPTATSTVVRSNFPSDTISARQPAGHRRAPPPEDVSVNAARGNKDFDNGGSTVAECSGCLSDADSFDPRPAVRGDVARMIFYMAVRYDGGDGFADLEPNDQVNNGSAPGIGKLSVLKAWSAGDPPDAFEKRRNQVIFDNWQHNRNPFIDHPEWVNSIWP